MSEPGEMQSTEVPAGTAPKTRLARRRLLKLGMGGAGAAATLASRPVLAWQCGTTSAWGSAQLNPTASVTARATVHSVTEDTWTLKNWKENSITGSNMATPPWDYLKTATGYTTGSLKVSDLFGSTIPAGVLATDKVWNSLSNTSVPEFSKYMMAARLNFRLVPAVQQCLVTNSVDQLALMVDGVYAPPNLSGTLTWDSAEIIRYLQNNSIVRAY